MGPVVCMQFAVSKLKIIKIDYDIGQPLVAIFIIICNCAGLNLNPMNDLQNMNWLSGVTENDVKVELIKAIFQVKSSEYGAPIYTISALHSLIVLIVCLSFIEFAFRALMYREDPFFLGTIKIYCLV